MNLIVDIGNTRCKIAVFKDKTLLYKEIYNQFGVRQYNALKKAFDITDVILSNTGEVDPKLLDLLQDCNCFVRLDHRTSLPISNKYATPETLGRDRLAAAVGAIRIFPKSNILIIDMGTCITLDFVNLNGEFLGGNISPGINMRLKAMHKFTASLPLVEMNYNQDLFGNSTTTALQNGAVKGTILELDAFINTVSEKYDAINVILTGGDAHFFDKWTKNKIFVAPNLVLEGLNEILQYNEY